MSDEKYDKMQRLLDYHLNLDDPSQRRQTEESLAEDEQMRKLSGALEQCLRPLSAWPDEEPPAGLAERTEAFIAQHRQAQTIAQASAAIATRRKRVRSEEVTGGSRVSWALGNLRDLIAVAACLMLVVMVAQPSIREARQVARRRDCQANMANIGNALATYAQDNQGRMPYVKRRPNSVWWRVGGKGEANTSNTRNIYLLVKGEYASPESFLCPGGQRRRHVRIRIPIEKLRLRPDFASRDHVNYSFRLIFRDTTLDWDDGPLGAVMADLNPLFDKFDPDRQSELNLVERPSLLQANSPNHGGRGQNVLFRDGSVHFSVNRHLGPTLDDIFTIRNIRQYRGTELPAAGDVFVP